MAYTNISPALAVTLGVWLAALGSAAALAYDLNRPLHLRTTTQIEVPLDPSRVAVAEPISEGSSVLYLPEVTIVGQAFLPAPVPSAVESIPHSHR